jgi:uncharacterized protein (DUF169 family)
MRFDMVTIEEVHRYGAELESWLRMRAHPIAVRMLKSRGEVPEGAIIPTRDWGHKYSLCQSFARSEREGLTIAMFKEDMWCFEPAVGLGLVPRIRYFLEGHHRYPDSVRDLNAAAEWCQNMPHLDHGEYQGIISAPVNNCSFLPDVIVMHVTGLQLTYLLIVKNWIDGKDIYAQLSGHAACVYAVVPSIKSRGCYVAIPCRGDRRLAMAQDDELIFSLPPDMLPEFIEGAHWLQEHGWGLPLIQELKEEYPLKPAYAKLGEMLGLDARQSPPRPQRYQRW